MSPLRASAIVAGNGVYRFGVSYQAILWRLLNLQWMSATQRKRLAGVSPTAVAEQLGYEIEPGQAETKPNRQRRLAFGRGARETSATDKSPG
jgi:hypothetical protein